MPKRDASRGDASSDDASSDAASRDAASWRTAHDEARVLRAILEGTAAETGQPFFRALVRSTAEALGVAGCWVTELMEEEARLRSLAFWLRDDFVEGYEYALPGTPCDPVIREHRLVLVPDRVVELYPDDPDLAPLGAVSYMGFPLEDVGGEVLGHLAVLHDRPLSATPRTDAIFRIFAARAGAELRRLRAEAAVREREEELTALVSGALDAILWLDAEGRPLRANPAALAMFGTPAPRLVGADSSRLFSAESRIRLRRLMEDLDGRPEGHRSAWITGGLEGLRAGGRRFPIEGTCVRLEVRLGMRREVRYVLLLRDIEARVEAERRLAALVAEADYLREEIQALEGSEDILGESEALRRLLDEARRVAESDATVLILGETGTGKELLARAIHDASRRRGRPLIRVNCAALPAHLVESELFGHEKGAFTGATARRQGRFALADGGTLFLDEVGELPLDLQPKLLRALQEGEFEPVGSEGTRTVDVRVLAATNRDLRAQVREGRFREDLYYRLNVIPLRLPPLRERGRDVELLARAFVEALQKRHGRRVDPLDAGDLARLRAYPWPGNVRELRNVLERAILTARDGRMELGRMLGGDGSAAWAGGVEGSGGLEGPGELGQFAELRDLGEPRGSANEAAGPRILTEGEFRALERANLFRALEATGWQVAGEGGAARLLGLPPTTLASRLRTLGMRRPAGE